MERTFRLGTAVARIRGAPSIIRAVRIGAGDKPATDATFCFTNRCNDCGCNNDCGAQCDCNDYCMCENHCACDPECSRDCTCYHYGGPG
jgi:hypothetical protein